MSRIENRERLLRKMAALPAVARKVMAEAVQTSADELVALQRRLCPTKTGALRDSITVRKGSFSLASSGILAAGGGARSGLTVRGDDDLTATITAGSKTAYYARFVEFGTLKTLPQPFFYPPYRLMKRRLKGRISRSARKAAKAVAAGG